MKHPPQRTVRPVEPAHGILGVLPSCQTNNELNPLLSLREKKQLRWRKSPFFLSILALRPSMQLSVSSSSSNSQPQLTAFKPSRDEFGCFWNELLTALLVKDSRFSPSIIVFFFLCSRSSFLFTVHWLDCIHEGHKFYPVYTAWISIYSLSVCSGPVAIPNLSFSAPRNPV